MKFLGWTATILVVFVLAWITATAESLVPRFLGSGILAGIGLIAGLRIGHQSANRYITDLQRLNKVICDQHRDLEDLNVTLLKHVNAETKSTVAGENLM